MSVLQFLLAVGILPISMAWGGRQVELTGGLRIASLASIVVLAVFAWVIRRRAGLMGDSSSSRAIRMSAWVITAFMGLNTLGNLLSESSGERLLFTPTSLLLAVSTLVVASSKTPKSKPNS